MKYIFNINYYILFVEIINSQFLILLSLFLQFMILNTNYFYKKKDLESLNADYSNTQLKLKLKLNIYIHNLFKLKYVHNLIYIKIYR